MAAALGGGIAVVIMGVSGAGKSTIGEMLARETNSSFIDADDFHPQSNKEKMRKGIPLTEEDRMPWLEKLRNGVRDKLLGGGTVILGLEKRITEGKHFMSPALLQSQLGLLQIDDSEGILKVDATLNSSRNCKDHSKIDFRFKSSEL
ncbi:hypothetical protein DVH24_022304 [Malus domestica]|uniref:gluconokinase n=1 Tax=Malus domestica TaxID=3750 RepID=A0A498KIQ4_MALDO|nr:hypothetical protein DVH24_022304 [Malus domestica]